MRSAAVYGDYLRVFKQARLGQAGSRAPYHTAALGNVVNYFFPRPQSHCGRGSRDAGPERCALHRRAERAGPRRDVRRSESCSTPCTATRGVWIAKRLRKL